MDPSTVRQAIVDLDRASQVLALEVPLADQDPDTKLPGNDYIALLQQELKSQSKTNTCVSPLARSNSEEETFWPVSLDEDLEFNTVHY
mmetsp:Transcript_472/g.972  ORF Transcript_472/g.972 Transcript_472/m.972 type:complete len:88 (-) Transcript_472:49-312(-)